MEAFLDRLNEIPFLLPLAIMFLRIIDVSIGTVRMIMVFRNRRFVAASLGFFEVIIWLTAITGIISHINNWLNIVFYGLGFALGNVVGMLIENKVAIGQQVVRFISTNEGDRITGAIREKGYGVTEVVALGRGGPVGLGFVITSRKKVKTLLAIISEIDPKAVVTIEDVRQSNIIDYFQPAQIESRWLSFLKKK